MEFIALGPQSLWTFPLRSGRSRTLYVSFSMRTSLGTQVRAGGAGITLLRSDQRDGFATLTVLDGDTWMRLRHDVMVHTYDGVEMGSFACITFAIDGRSRTWSCFADCRLIATDLKLGPANPKVEIETTDGIAWLCGVAFCDKNPLYVDDNDNGVPDSFEVRRSGSVIANDATDEAVRNLRLAWRRELRVNPPPRPTLAMPQPDAESLRRATLRHLESAENNLESAP